MSAAKPASAGPAVAATLAAAVLWGTSFNVNDYGLRFAGPATFVVLRFAIAGLVMLLVARFAGRLDARLLREPWFWLMALLNGLGFLLQHVGQLYTTPARTALFVNTTAFTVALMERFLFGQKLGPWRSAAIVLGVTGAAILITGGDPRTLEGGRLLGDLITLASGLTWAVYFMMNRKTVGQHDPLNVTAWTFTLTSLLMIPALLLDPAPMRFSTEGALAILYTGLVTTALAFGLWAWGLRGIRASVSAVLLLAEILVASLLSVAIGRETFGAIEVLGALLLVLAVAGMSLAAAHDAERDAEPAAA